MTDIKSQQADVSVLDLLRPVRRWIERAGSDEGDEDVLAALDRIASLLPQQPVQARTTSGDPIWQHIPCGWPHPWHPDVEPDTGPDGDPLGCHKPGLWRPPLVGGTPAPEGECGAVFTHPTKGAQPPCSRPRDHGGEADPSYHSNGMFKWLDQPDLVAQVMAELGVDRLGDVVPAIADLREQLRLTQQDRHRDGARLTEARAEVERLKAQVNSEIEQADERAAWADRLAWAALKRTGVRETEEASGNNELWQLALDALTARLDPLVLSLPEVPEGAVALVGSTSGRRFTRVDRDGPADWWNAEDGRQSLIGVLQLEGSATVEMAPPREPRTWPKLDDAPVDLKAVRGESGEIWRRNQAAGMSWDCEALGSRGMAFGDLQQFDGPLTEVFDEPGDAS